MEFEEQDIDVIRLLGGLKEADGHYPVELMASRRQIFTRQVAVFGIGAVGAALALNAAAKGAGGFSVPPIAAIILETVLIVVIAAEVGIVTFLNRKEILDLFQIIASPPGVEQIITDTPSNPEVPLVEPTLIDPPEIVTETRTSISTSTAIGTPSPVTVHLTDTAGDVVETDDQFQENSTPAPHVNNGNHFGQTPKPERTRNPGRDRDSGGDNPNSRRNR